MAAVDKDGNPTTDPNAAVSLLPFGAHKGYGLSLINEIVGAFIGGSLPTLRSRWADGDEKHTCAFFFQVIHPGRHERRRFRPGPHPGAERQGRDRRHPGPRQREGHAPRPARGRAGPRRRAAAGGLLFSQAEIEAFNELATEAGQPAWKLEGFKTFTV